MFEEYRTNVTSQFGEDGILLHLFQRLGIREGWCVEFGAWDGKSCSNTYNLIINHGWHGILIEASGRRFAKLRENLKDRPNVILLNKTVGFTTSDCLDAILQATPIPPDFDLLSIDIDGNDYHVWKKVANYRPKVVIIEFNQTIPNDVEFVQARDVNVNQGNSLLALQKLGLEKGYRLLCCTDINAIFIYQDFTPCFPEQVDNLNVINPQTKYYTSLFQLYDGTLKISGCNRMIWRGIGISEKRLQILPAILRRLPTGDDSIIRKIVSRLLLRLLGLR
jgi:hypothetical protein